MILTNFAIVGNAAESKPELNVMIVSNGENDLYKTLVDNYSGIRLYATLDEALQEAQQDQGIMVMADDYPTATPVSVSDEQVTKIREYNIRLYVEYAANNDALGITGYGSGNDGLRGMQFNRAVVVNGEALNMADYSLLYVHGARFRKKTDVSNAWLVSAKVAGYDTADFGLENTEPFVLLEENAEGNVLIASTKLSQFISGRYAPYERWQTLWQSVLSWVTQSQVSPMEWRPAMNPHYGADEMLADDAYSEAVRLNTQWYMNSGVMPGSDGTDGIYECFKSGGSFDIYGDQKLSTTMRADCNGESAGNLALAGVVLNNEAYKNVAYNVTEWLLQSSMATGDRSDPTSAQYGLLSWNTLDSGLESYYGDDNAKAILGMIIAASALEEDKWDQRILEVILANFRTTGVYGFRSGKLFGSNLENYGWEYYYNQETVNYASHYESLLWGCYLWAYDKTGYEPLLERSKTAISMMMAAYEKTMKKDVDDGTGEWTWTNGMQQERAKMLLSLAWLARIEPTDEHIGWLNTMITDLMAYQDADTGALREAIGEEGEGIAKYGPFTSNDQYGQHEAPVIQKNGDPCSDALYTSSFAMMTLNEAYAAMIATGNQELAATYKSYLDALADYLVRIQQVSDNDKYNGVWTRGFDYEKWEVYGSDGDAGWGIWCTETGWSQAWISSTLSLMLLDTNIWDYTKTTTVNDHFADTAALMLTPSGETPAPTATCDTKLKFSAGAGVWLDGIYGSTAWTDGCWNGSEGTDMEIVVDYKESKTFDGVVTGFNLNMNTGVCPPSSVTYYVSDDGVAYTEVGSITITTDVQSEYDNRGTSGEIVRPTAVFDQRVCGRYLKVVLKNAGTYQRPQGITKTWIFMDELELYTIDPNAFAPWENETSEAYCEACGKLVSGWIPMVDNSTVILANAGESIGRIGDITTGKHYHIYLSESYTFEGNFGTVTSGTKICLHTNGKNLTYQGRLFANGTSEINIMGDGSISTDGTHTLAEATLVLNGTAKLHLYGGTFTTTSKYGSPVLLSAGSGATVTIEDGVVIDGNHTGRSIKVAGADRVIMNGGTVQNGFYSLSKPGIEPNKSFALITGATTRNGGNVFLAKGATFTMNGGTIKDGVAGSDANGTNDMYAGNVFVYGSTFIMNGGAIENGGATSSWTAGNIYITEGGSFTLNSGIIKGGHRLSTDNATKLTTAAGGNVYIYRGNFNMNGGTVSNTNHAAQGANFCLNGGSAANKAVLNVAGGMISSGKAIYGGNICLSGTSNHAVLNMTGGTVFGGVATGNGGDIYAKGALSQVMISGGTVYSDVYAGEGSVMALSGGSVGADVLVLNRMYLGGSGSAECLQLESGAQLFVDKDWNGSASVTTEQNLGYGQTVDGIQWGTCGAVQTDSAWTFSFANGEADDTAYIGQLTQADAPYRNLFAAADGQVKTAGAGYVDAAGKTVWAADNAAALQAYDFTKDQCVMLTGTAELTGDIRLKPLDDSLVLSGNGKVHGIDSSNDTYESYHTVTIAEGADVTWAMETVDPATGHRYVAVMKEGELSFRRLELRLTHVTLRTTKAGIYYKATATCDDALRQKIASYGIAVSVVQMPTAAFKSEQYTAYTSISGAPEGTFTSGSVFNIFREGLAAEKNMGRGEMKIYAKPYIKLKDGTILMAQAGAAYSLLDVLQTMDNHWLDYSQTAKAMAKVFYQAWAQYGMDAWADKLPNMTS